MISPLNRTANAIGIVVVSSFFCLPLMAGEKLNFNRDVRPILSDTCFHCHGPDDKKREGELRLDLREQALKAGSSGKNAIVPERPDQSELIRRLTSSDPNERMPPKDSGKQITPRQIEILKRWIEEGAEYQGHWSFLPVQRPPLPEVKNQAWAKTGIDRFILARLEKEGLRPTAEASKETLIRRLSLDLTGLPPTPAEVDAFLADKSPEAYEKVVDRLLASPHYGERMALQWLDFARYADSNGFQTDGSRYMWPWRDWVIQAYNQNMPFDQFTIEQLGGDLLPNATTSQLVATGFNRNHRINGEGGIIAEEWRIENIIDRVETLGLTWMGLTFNCCRCHDHKYDPISQKEFYQLFAYFNNVPESGTITGPANREGANSDPVLRIPTPEQEATLAKKREALAAIEKQLKDAKVDVPKWQAEWEETFKSQLKEATSAWIPLDVKKAESTGRSKLTQQTDGSWLASGPNPANDTYTITATMPAGKLTGLKLETLPDPSLPNKGLGRAKNANFILSGVECVVTATSLLDPVAAKLDKAEASYSQKGYEIGLLLDNNPKNGWAVDGPTRNEPTSAMFLFASAIDVPEKATLTIKLKHDAAREHNIGRFRLSATGHEPSLVKLDGPVQPPAKVIAALEIPAAKRSAAQKSEVEKFFLANATTPLKKFDVEIATVKKEISDLERNIPNVMIMREADKPRDAFLLVRGEYDRPGEKVTAALPQALPKMPEEAPNNRLGLARWLVDRSHPLTSRVWVNRLWEKYFGSGIVKTSENFGSQAEYPMHPELLDWLAAEFMEPTAVPSVNGTPARPWDLKAIQKLIVTSAAYRQSSQVTPQLLEKDPENRLLARGPRFRLQAELLRDQALAISGLLVPKIGGPSVRPYMPEGVWDETSVYGDLRNYKADKGEGLYRRSMYTVWKRTAAPPTMLIFDAPNRETCSVKRSRTNTPLQALSLLNEVTFVEAARKLGEQMLTAGGKTVDERLVFGFRMATSRKPTAEELSILREGLAADLVRFNADTAAAEKLLAFGAAKSAEQIPVAELAAYAVTANVLLNLDEVVSRE